MDKDTTLRLAREAGAHWEYSRSHPVPCVFGDDESLMRFAALVAEHLKSEGYRQCAKGQRTTQFCGMVEQAVRDEREECAKVLEKLEQEWEDAELWASFKTIGIAIDAIRSRTNPVK